MHEHRSRSPVKKSRALSTPAEVDENDNEEQDENFVDASENEGPASSPDPSPPHESKVFQISVEDINWRNGQGTPQAGIDIAPVTTAPDDAAPPEPQAQIGTSSPTSTVPTPEIQNQSGTMKVSAAEDVDPSMPIAEAASAASSESLSAPPITTVPPVIEDVRATTPAMPQSQPAATPPRDPDSPPIKELSGDDAGEDTNPKEIKRPTPPHSEIDGATKRPREDEDGDVDPNPREPKRASPPPEKEIEKKDRPTKKKNGSDSHTSSTPASPRTKSGSVFVGHSRFPICWVV